MLATSSQDAKIRLWRIADTSTSASASSTTDLLASLSMNTNTKGTTTISSKGHIFRFGEIKYAVLLESVLNAHEDWVYSVDWKPIEEKEGTKGIRPEISVNNTFIGKPFQDMCLLSASMDKSMIVWRPSEKLGGVWIDEVRVGELGGNTLGFYGGLFSAKGDSILAHGYSGAFHLWTKGSAEEGILIIIGC
jgi:elongator complex protein 2